MLDHEDIAGIDGCKAGWIIATANGAVVLPTLALEDFALVGIDMPIGLSDGPQRACDIEARKFLGRARSSVFPAPPRAALSCTTYESALATARSATGRGISLQTYNIMAKVGQLDRLVDPTDPDRVIEVHPECAFKALNDDQGLPPKRTRDGTVVRRRLLAAHFDLPMTAPRGAAIDDLLDAYAVLWSARRFQRGEHRVFGDGATDGRGLEMRIVC
jgi:predicted RNase H-like nuclease